MCRQAVFLKTNDQAFEIDEENIGRERRIKNVKEGTLPQAMSPLCLSVF